MESDDAPKTSVREGKIPARKIFFTDEQKHVGRCLIPLRIPQRQNSPDSMLRAVFSGQRGASYSVGPFAELRFERNALRASPVGPVLAEHRGHSWQLRGESYTHFDCDGPLSVEFQHADGTKARRSGPYFHLSAVDGVLYVDRRVFATYQEGTGVWTIEATGAGWAIVVAIGT
jgi:hypothetical protein